MPLDILKLTKHFMRDPAKILVKNEELTLEGIKQYYIAIEKEEWKIDILLDLYGNLDISQALIYCNTKKRVTELSDTMKQKDLAKVLVEELLAMGLSDAVLGSMS